MDVYQQKTQRIQTQTIRAQKRALRRAEKVKVQCMECGKKWLVSPNANGPYCPKCNSSDVEVL